MFNDLAARAALRALGPAPVLLLAACSGDKPVESPALSLSAEPVVIVAGQPSELRWHSLRATTCEASGAWSGQKPLSGTEAVSSANGGQFTYSLSCADDDGRMVSRSVQITVEDRSDVFFSLAAVPNPIRRTESASLQWNAGTLSDCTASGQWSGPRASTGTESTGSKDATGTYQYHLTCRDLDGSEVSRTAALVVGDPTTPSLHFHVDPEFILVGEAADLVWTATEVVSCAASGSWTGARPVSGGMSTGPITIAGSLNYGLTCVDRYGATVGKTVSLEVGHPLVWDQTRWNAGRWR